MFLLYPWHWLVHTIGVDYGVPFGHWIWYNFWSGFAGSFAVGLIAYFFLFYWHHTCHEGPWCLRWGKYEAAGGMFKLCRRHHPDMQSVEPLHDLINRLHHEHKERTRAGAPPA